MRFIFSTRPAYRIGRHVSFWMASFLSQAAVAFIVPSLFNRSNAERIFEATYGQLLYLPGQLLLVYSLLYFVIPTYILKTKYRSAFISVIALCIVTGFVTAVSYWMLVDKSVTFYFGHNNREPVKDFTFYIPTGFILGLRSALIVAGFASAIKLMKLWYEKEVRNTILQKEKISSELQSLRAQLHPHFLFNTLNNIYSLTEKTSPAASGMLVKLSDLLRYMLYECDKPTIEISKEFRILQDYASLEKIRYNEKLDLNITLPMETNGYHIAPLLLLPLAENCFKHGSSRMIEQPWIKITAETRDGKLHMKLINGKSAKATHPGNGHGIGISNVRKRLELLYPLKHKLDIISEPDVFIVNLEIELDHFPSAAIG